MVRVTQLITGLATVLFLANPHAIADGRRPDRDAASDATATAASLSAPAWTHSTCEARTINYITHTLPQSCLTSTWTSTPPNATTTNSVSVDATENNGAIGANATATASEQTEAAATEATVSVDVSASTTLPPSEPLEASTPAEPTHTSFMSFEDWKEMMLKQSGQDPQNVGQKRQKEAANNERNPPDMIHGLGEEDEILLNFDNYDDKNHDHSNDPKSEHDEVDNSLIYEDGKPVIRRSKDAGKTCKERFSYSSFDAGATVLKTSPGAKNAKAILVENKDSYLLLECATQNKFVIVELSDDILVDTIVLANFEFFSSMVRHFRLSVSDRYPVKLDKWVDLGTFETRNSRDIQAFLVEHPQIWAKYVRIEFLTHYGNEYYCPVSLIRVHGSRMLDSWKDAETGREDEGLIEGEGSETSEGDAQVEIQPHETATIETKADEPATQDTAQEPVPVTRDISLVPDPHLIFSCVDETCPMPSPIQHESTLTQPEGDAPDAPEDKKEESESQFKEKEAGNSATSSKPPATERPMNATVAATSMPTVQVVSQNATSERSVNSTPTTNTTALNPTDASTNSTAQASSKSSAASGSSSASSKAPSSPSTTPKSRSTGTTSSSPSSPTVQQGFFNAITKRLQQVEANLTLSLKYVEDQSRHMQDALQRAEQKQSTKVTSFLDELNSTVLSELRSVRDQYEQIWQSTIIALDSQRDHSERDIVALSSRLNLLADEVIFQKRMAIVQAVLLLSCLFLVIFSRGISLPSLAPLVEQNVPSPYAPPLRNRIDSHALYHSHPDGNLPPAQHVPPSPVSSFSADAVIPSKRSLPVGTTLSPPPDELPPVPEVDPEPAPDESAFDHHPSPPMTPSTREDTPEVLSATGYDFGGEDLAHEGLETQTFRSRKPLPALPEDTGIL